MAETTLAEYLETRDAPCPGCGYELRGVREKTCPECGRKIMLFELQHIASRQVDETKARGSQEFDGTWYAKAFLFALGFFVVGLVTLVLLFVVLIPLSAGGPFL